MVASCSIRLCLGKGMMLNVFEVIVYGRGNRELLAASWVSNARDDRARKMPTQKRAASTPESLAPTQWELSHTHYEPKCLGAGGARRGRGGNAPPPLKESPSA